MRRQFTLYSIALNFALGAASSVLAQPQIALFPTPTAYSGPAGITSGPDGNLWFTENYSNKIGRITTCGVITEFPIPTPGSGPLGIATGLDGNLWFTENTAGSGKIGQITTDGTITEFPLPDPYSR